MSYYRFNREDLLKKANEKYYKDNKGAIKKARNKYKNLTKEEKELKRRYSRNRYCKLKQQYKE